MLARGVPGDEPMYLTCTLPSRLPQDLQLCLQRERGQHQRELSVLEAAHCKKLRSFAQPSHTAPDTEEIRRQEQQLEGGAVLEDNGRVGPAASETIRQNLLSALEEVSLDETDGEDGREERREEDGGTAFASVRTQLEESREKCVGIEREVEQLRVQLRESREERRGEREIVEELRSEVQALQTRNAALESERGLAAESRVERMRETVNRLEEENSRLTVVGEQQAAQHQVQLGDTQSMNESE